MENKNKEKKITIIIPAYNEKECIAIELKEMVSQLHNVAQEYSYEIIVVDDGSTDKTGAIAESEGVKVIRHDINRGYGAAIKTGIANAQCGYILICDADATYPKQAIPELLKNLDGNDMVVGARKSDNNYREIHRRFVKYLLKKLSEYLCETKIPDLNSGLRVFKKDVALKFLNILPNGFSFTATITLAMLTNNYKVKYVPIDYKKRIGKSKIRAFKDTINFLQLIIKTVMYFNPLKVFVPMSLFLFLAGIGIMVYSYFFMEKVMDITTIILILASFQILAIGMLADLIDKRMKP